MLRTEQQGALNGVMMGQRSSRVESIDAASPIDRMAFNGDINGTNEGLLQASASPRLASSFTRSPEEGLSIRGTSKRTRDERDKDEYDANGNYRVHFSRSNTQRKPDRYSSQGQNGSVSPADVRHTFVPERSDHWSPKKRRQHHRENSSSSNAAHRQGRTDQYIPGLASSPRSPSPPPRPRPPLGPRANSGMSNNQSRFEPKSSRREHSGSESMEKARYTSLTWTAPGWKSKQTSTDSAQRTSAAGIQSPLSPSETTRNRVEEPTVGQKVDVNGIKGVPTGPKSDPRAILAWLGGRRPYIFIPGTSLPPQPATLPHLYKFLAKYINKASDIELNDKGYYLYFESTEAGLDRLDQCYWAKNGHVMFGQYVLDLVRHHDGKDNRVVNTNINTHGHPTTMDVPPTNPLSDTPKQTGTAVGLVATSFPPPPQGHQNAITADPCLGLRKTTAATSVIFESADTGAPPILRHSSPLRVPSRQDKDDASSSISGFTGSDLSASRVSKCHVCRETPVADSDSLVQCSSCPRRWHRRCHKEPIPQDLESQHIWQCRRCIKKNVPPKSMLSNASFASASPAPSVGQPEEPPAKKPRLTYTTPDLESTNVARFSAAAISSGLPQREPELHLNGTTTDPAMSMTSDISEVETATDLGVQVNSDDLRISEVDDLVERSFTSTVETKKPEQKAKFFLHLTRKKIARSEQDTSTENDNRNESNSTPSEGRVDSFDAPGQDAEVDDTANTPKRERHKWKGGGADKDIIQAGMQNFFSERSVQKEGTATTQGRNRGEQKSSSIPTLHVPESRDDSRTVDNANGSINERDSQHVATQSPPKVKLKINGPKPSDDRAMKLSEPQTASGQRMKPGRISADKCKMCSKTIAFNPAGSKICSACKKEAASAEPAMPSACEALTEDKMTENVVTPEQFKAAQISDNIGALLNSSGPDEDEGDAESSRSESPQPVEDQEPALVSPKSMRPCDSCRFRHKRCTHRSDEGAISSRREDITVEDTGKDDLDFWNTVADENNTGNLVDSNFDDRQPTINNRPITTAASRDRSSSLSPAPDDAQTIPTKIKKRVSHARAATSEYDLGDSRERPPNTYKKLIGMALCAAPTYCLKASEIIRWIADNVPGYGLGEGTGWESGISATLSMNREKDGNAGLWRKIGGEGTRKNDPCWYQLQPGQEYEMLHWDPVLKQPVSPMQRRNEQGSSRKSDKPIEGSSTHDISVTETLAETSASPTLVSKRRLKLKPGKIPSIARKHAPRTAGSAAEVSQTMHQGTAMSNINTDELQLPDPGEGKEAESSDDEPIAESRKKRPSVLPHVAQATAPRVGTNDDAKHRELLNGVSESSESNISRMPAKLSIMRQFTFPSPSAAADKKIVAQLIKEDTENVDNSARSLFKEWPELDPANELDREAKINEIRRRPTRKQKFGVKSHEQYSAAWKPDRLNRNYTSSYTPPRPNRSTRNFETDVFGWQANDEVKHFDSLEDMFDLPNPRFSIMQEGQIAYRDGIRSEFDGAPRRAKRIYNTGYAKHH